MARRRVLYTVNRMDVGGSQTHLIQVLRLLDRERFEPILCCLTGKGALLDVARATGTTVLAGGLEGLKSPRALAALARLRGFMRRERIDVVHNYLLRANVVGTLAARAAGVPVVLTSKRGCHERAGWEMIGARLSNKKRGKFRERLASRACSHSAAMQLSKQVPARGNYSNALTR